MSASLIRRPRAPAPAGTDLHAVTEAPRDYDAERSVLAAMMFGHDAVARARAALPPEAFHLSAHAAIFQAILALDERGEPADLVTLRSKLRASGDLEMAGGWIDKILDMVTTSKNLDHHIRLVRTAYARRRALKISTALGEAIAAGNGVALSEVLSKHIAQLEGIEPEGKPGAGRFADAAADAATFVALEIPKPRSLLGDGVLAAGGFAVIFGKPGLGKSWAALTLAHSVARGQEWMGLATPSEGVRVGALQFELPAYQMQARLKALGIGSHERDGWLRVLCRPMLTGVVDLYRRPEDLEALRQWITRDRLELLVIDALSRAHTANENKAEELGQVLAALDAIRHETGCALGLVHHEPKERDERRGTQNHLDALRGTSRLQSDPTLLVRVHQSHGGLRCLRFVKVSEGAEPDPIYFTLDPETGVPRVAQAPESAGQENRDRVLQVVLAATGPLSSSEVAERAGCSKSTARDHLAALHREGQIGSSGENRNRKYYPPTHRPAGPAERVESAGATLWENA